MAQISLRPPPAHAASLVGDSLTPPRLDLSLEPITGPTTLGRAWSDLETRSDASYFQSWAWVGTWLAVLPPDVASYALIARAQGEVLGLATLCRRRTTRHGWLRSEALHVNETGRRDLDCLTAEYSGPIVDRRFGLAIERAMIAFLVEHAPDWDELMLSGVDPRYCALVEAAGLSVHVLSEQECPYVDLDAVRRAGGDYLALLSANTRQQIRRAVRLYGQSGPIRTQVPAGVDEAVQFFGGLKRLHQASWTARGQPGSFANPFFERFHTQLIRDQFASGEIQLLRVDAGDAPVGYLYSFVKDGRILFYQSGFNYHDSPKMKPGLVCHHAAIERNLAAGARIYDFLAGDSQYKRSLSTASTRVLWLAGRRNRLKFRVEDTLRAAKNWFSRRSALTLSRPESSATSESGQN